MSDADRDTYLAAVAKSFDTFLTIDNQSRGVVQLLVPQLDPSSDVYCRRFLLSFAWTLARISAASRLLKTAILVQAPSPTGATPLSVAGLSRMLSADWAQSRDIWPANVLRLGLLATDGTGATANDEVVIILSPTNAVDVPTVVSVQKLADSLPPSTKIVLVNPRLADVPGHSGVMGVLGRAERISTLASFHNIFTTRLLYTAGTVYPVQGALYHTIGEQWSVWRAERDELSYSRIAVFDSHPSPTQITDAFAADRLVREKLLMENAGADGFESIPLPLLIGALAFSIGIALVAMRTSGPL